jgi:hypothetical protein
VDIRRLSRVGCIWPSPPLTSFPGEPGEKGLQNGSEVVSHPDQPNDPLPSSTQSAELFLTVREVSRLNFRGHRKSSQRRRQRGRSGGGLRGRQRTSRKRLHRSGMVRIRPSAPRWPRAVTRQGTSRGVATGSARRMTGNFDSIIANGNRPARHRPTRTCRRLDPLRQLRQNHSH